MVTAIAPVLVVMATVVAEVTRALIVASTTTIVRLTATVAVMAVVLIEAAVATGLATVVVAFATKESITPCFNPKASAIFHRGFFVAGVARLREAVPEGLNSGEPSYFSSVYKTWLVPKRITYFGVPKRERSDVHRRGESDPCDGQGFLRWKSFVGQRG